MTEAYTALVPAGSPSSSYHYCVSVRHKRNGNVVLFEPAELTTYTVPAAALRPPRAYQAELRPARLARAIRRQLKAFKRHGRRCDRATAKTVLAYLEGQA